MSIKQATFNNDYGTRRAGMKTDNELSNVVSRYLEGTVSIPFGAPVYKGATDRGVIATPSAGNLVGFVEENVGMLVTATRLPDTYAPGDRLPVVERGGTATESVTAGNKDQPVFVTPAGKISNASAGNVAATGWVFDETIAAAGIVAIARR
jgi:hypothetical protein